MSLANNCKIKMPLFAAPQQMDFYNTLLEIFKRRLKAVRRQIGLAGEKVQPKHFFHYHKAKISALQRSGDNAATVPTPVTGTPAVPRHQHGAWGSVGRSYGAGFGRGVRDTAMGG